MIWFIILSKRLRLTGGKQLTAITGTGSGGVAAPAGAGTEGGTVGGGNVLLS